MNLFSSAGVAAGLLIGIIIVIILYKIVNTNHRAKTEYDERQQVIRGRGYMYGFYAFVIVECILLVLSIGEIPLPLSDFILHFCSIIIGCMVLCCYCIWKGAYWGINNNPKRYAIVFIALCILNAIPVIGAAAGGELIQDGRPGFAFVNLIVLIMFGVISVELIVKHIVDQRSATGEE